MEGGAGSMARQIADGLGDGVHLRTPVRAITQRDDRVVVEADELSVSARHAIVSVPPRSPWRSHSIRCSQRTGERCTPTRWPDRSRRPSSCTTSRSGGQTASAARVRSPVRSAR